MPWRSCWCAISTIRVMARLTERARRNQRSLQAEARAILEAAAPRYTKDEALEVFRTWQERFRERPMSDSTGTGERSRGRSQRRGQVVLAGGARGARAVSGRDRAFLAPDLLGAEFANALWKKQRRREMDGAAVAGILDNFRRVAIETFSLMPLLPMALAIASAVGHSVYACLYLALAEREDCPLVTADRRFYQAFIGGHLGHRMLWVEAFGS
jgi:predicted nucleic acid-binding protein